MTPSVLHPAFKKIERALRLIDELEASFKRFSSQDVREFVVDREAAAEGRSGIVLRLHRVATDDDSVIVGEAIYLLRSSLDVAAVALARHRGATDVGDVYFPFAKTTPTPTPNAAFRKKIELLAQPAQDLIVNEIKPWPGGDELLCGLNKLRNNDAHVELLPMVTQGGNGVWCGPRGNLVEEMVGAEIASILMGTLASQNIQVLHDGLRLNLSGAGIPAQIAADVANKRLGVWAFICLSGGGAFDGVPVVELLRDLHGHVHHVLTRLEAVA